MSRHYLTSSKIIFDNNLSADTTKQTFHTLEKIKTEISPNLVGVVNINITADTAHNNLHSLFYNTDRMQVETYVNGYKNVLEDKNIIVYQCAGSNDICMIGSYLNDIVYDASDNRDYYDGAYTFKLHTRPDERGLRFICLGPTLNISACGRLAYYLDTYPDDKLVLFFGAVKSNSAGLLLRTLRAGGNIPRVAAVICGENEQSHNIEIEYESLIWLSPAHGNIMTLLYKDDRTLSWSFK